jgi:two-component system nitrate/nitrite response regulator NarL
MTGEPPRPQSLEITRVPYIRRSEVSDHASDKWRSTTRCRLRIQPTFSAPALSITHYLEDERTLVPESPLPSRVLIAGSQPIFRAALAKLLEAEPGFTVVGRASSATEAVRLVSELMPDVILLELNEPSLVGLEALRELTAMPTPCRVILLSAPIQSGQILEAFALGVRGVVTKEATTDFLFNSIRCVIAEQYWVKYETVSELLQYLHLNRVRALDKQRSQEKFHLTLREMQVIALVTAGHPNKSIAHRLSLSESTVKHHLSNIFDKLGVSDRLELALFAIHHRLEDGKMML